MTIKSYPPEMLLDAYKLFHREQYPAKTETVYSTWTPRASRIPGIDKVVVYGMQYFCKKYLIDYFNEYFFNKSKLSVVTEYERFISHVFNIKNPESKHIAELHDLGYLPIRIKSLPEGTLCDIRVPMLTIENTDPKFFWLTNALETIASCILFLPSTSATTAFEYKKKLTSWAKKTNSDALEFVNFQAHDFSMRGMNGLEAACLSGSAHLTSFLGTDTIPAIYFHEMYYNADITKELIGTSVYATEHSCMCSGAASFSPNYGSLTERENLQIGEEKYIEYLIKELYPSGIVSVVSDTWDFWHVISTVIPKLKDTIMSRDGKMVIRPDSGDPVKIICGDPSSDSELVRKGAVEALWDIFGGTTSKEGYKCLDSHIGLIYGDAITLNRAEEISARLADKGFASTNIVYGVGSYSYNVVSRDTYGFALKATDVSIDDKEYAIFKDPATDNGIKKSQKGRVAVTKTSDGTLSCIDGLLINDVIEGDLLTTIFENSEMVKETSLSEIRNRLKSYLD